MSDDYDDSRPSTRQSIASNTSPYTSPKFSRKGPAGLGPAGFGQLLGQGFFQEQGPTRQNSTRDVGSSIVREGGNSRQGSSQFVASVKGNYSLMQQQPYHHQQQHHHQQGQVQHQHHQQEQGQEVLLDSYMEIAGGLVLTKSGEIFSYTLV